MAWPTQTLAGVYLLVLLITSVKGHTLIWTMESWEARIVLLYSAFVLIIVIIAALQKCDDV